MEGQEGGWVRVARRSDLGADEVLGVMAVGKDIALYEVEGRLYATSNICTHAYARLSDGWLDGTVIECPLHAARFDIRNGKVLDPPAVHDLATYPVRLVGEDIEIKLD
ncbi:MAG: non-heme iron oxygenase ferredoxin subunit [Stellaceae bacterium]